MSLFNGQPGKFRKSFIDQAEEQVFIVKEHYVLKSRTSRSGLQPHW